MAAAFDYADLRKARVLLGLVERGAIIDGSDASVDPDWLMQSVNTSDSRAKRSMLGLVFRS